MWQKMIDPRFSAARWSLCLLASQSQVLWDHQCSCQDALFESRSPSHQVCVTLMVSSQVLETVFKEDHNNEYCLDYRYQNPSFMKENWSSNMIIDVSKVGNSFMFLLPFMVPLFVHYLPPTYVSRIQKSWFFRNFKFWISKLFSWKPQHQTSNKIAHKLVGNLILQLDYFTAV